jgi:hypothetical protein
VETILLDKLIRCDSLSNNWQNEVTPLLGMEEFGGRARFFDYLTNIYRGGEAPSLHCFAFILSDDMNPRRTVEFARNRGLKVSIAPSGSDLYRLNIGIRTSSCAGYLVLVDGNWIYFTDAETSRVTSIVNSFARRMTPLLRLAYVPSPVLLETIGKITREYSQVLLTEGTIGTAGETFRNWKKAPMQFSIKEAHRQAAKEGGKWSSISIKCFQGKEEAVDCRFYERGHLTLYSGDYAQFYSTFLLPYFSSAVAVSNRMRGRERKEIDGKILLHPLTFNFGQRRISTRDMDMLSQKMVARYSAAVMHPGNPMLQIQLNDRHDGSAFDLYLFNTKLEIVPLQKSTPAALGELVALVSDILPTGLPEMV